MAASLFITGLGGYVGRRLLALLDVSRYARVTGLCRSTMPDTPGFTAVRGDLLDASSYADALSGCDCVIHLAAVTGKARRRDYLRSNTDGTAVLVNACRNTGVARFLFVSTIAARFADQRWYWYAQAKKEAERIVAQSGLRHCIVRPTMVLGVDAPVMEGLSKLARAPVVPVFGDGRAIVQPVFVDDLVQVLLSIVDQDLFDGRVFEVGGPDRVSIEELLLLVRRIRYGKGPRRVHLPVRWIKPVLGALEKVALPLLPVTAGQLCSFTNDGSVKDDPTVARLPRMRLDDLVRTIAEHDQ